MAFSEFFAFSRNGDLVAVTINPDNAAKYVKLKNGVVRNGHVTEEILYRYTDYYFPTMERAAQECRPLIVNSIERHTERLASAVRALGVANRTLGVTLPSSEVTGD